MIGCAWEEQWRAWKEQRCAGVWQVQCIAGRTLAHQELLQLSQEHAAGQCPKSSAGGPGADFVELNKEAGVLYKRDVFGCFAFKSILLFLYLFYINLNIFYIYC